MKKLIFLLSLLPAFQIIFATEFKKIEDVIQDNSLQAFFNYKPSGFHKSIKATITNVTRRPMVVVVDPGLLLQSERSNWQNHLITKRDTFSVKPGETKEVMLSAMCCESYDGGPGYNSRFTLVTNYRKDLIQLCKLIDSLHLNGYEAQSAIWNLANRRSPNNIIGGDSASVMRLRVFVGTELKKTIDPYDERMYVSRTRQLPSIAFHNTGILKLDSVDVDDKFVLELYNADNDTKIQNIGCDKIFLQQSFLSLFISNIKLNNLQANTNYIVRLKKNDALHMEWMYVIS